VAEQPVLGQYWSVPAEFDAVVSPLVVLAAATVLVVVVPISASVNVTAEKIASAVIAVASATESVFLSGRFIVTSPVG
jgi:hypothetical protein